VEYQRITGEILTTLDISRERRKEKGVGREKPMSDCSRRKRLLRRIQGLVRSGGGRSHFEGAPIVPKF